MAIQFEYDISTNKLVVVAPVDGYANKDRLMNNAPVEEFRYFISLFVSFIN